jgi:hypothetical protein
VVALRAACRPSPPVHGNERQPWACIHGTHPCLQGVPAALRWLVLHVPATAACEPCLRWLTRHNTLPACERCSCISHRLAGYHQFPSQVLQLPGNITETNLSRYQRPQEEAHARTGSRQAPTDSWIRLPAYDAAALHMTHNVAAGAADKCASGGARGSRLGGAVPGAASRSCLLLTPP